jgi:hypothetical protein
MQINRQTYEEFFLLYADGELSAAEKKSVEEFVKENPDLADEFNLILETVLQPDESVFFENKELLLKEEEDDRKVVPMRWFRFAVAAVVLITFSVIGWVFFGDKSLIRQPVAINKNQVPIIVNKQSPGISKPSDAIKTDAPSGKAVAEAVPERLNNTKNYARKLNSRTAEKNQPSSRPANREDVNEKPDADASEIIPDHSSISGALITAIPEKEIIDIPVTSREMEDEEYSNSNTPSYTHSYQQEDNNNDLIYFANTSLTKKTKLRGVLRKATRYLDRVTSIQ